MLKDGENILGLIKRAKVYGVSEDVIRNIIDRDQVCIYCSRKMLWHKSLIGTSGDKRTIEHFNEKYVYAAREDNVGICCGSCNSSRSDRNLLYWFKTQYCLENNISEKTVSSPIKEFIKKYPMNPEQLLKKIKKLETKASVTNKFVAELASIGMWNYEKEKANKKYGGIDQKSIGWDGFLNTPVLVITIAKTPKYQWQSGYTVESIVRRC